MIGVIRAAEVVSLILEYLPFVLERMSRVEKRVTALHQELTVDPLRWISESAAEKHWHSLDAVYQQMQLLIQIWSTAGAYDQFWRVAAMEELARQMQSSVDAYNDPDNVSWSDSRFYTGSRRAGDALVPSLRRHGARQVKSSGRPSSPSDASVDGRGGILEVQAATAPPPVQGPGGDEVDVAFGRNVGCLRWRSGGSQGNWRCSCGAAVRVRRARLRPEVFDDCSWVRRFFSSFAI